MTRRVRHIENDRWVVLDVDDTPLMTGSLRECEDWLDREENRDRARQSIWSRLFGWMGARSPGPPHRDNSSGDAERKGA